MRLAIGAATAVGVLISAQAGTVQARDLANPYAAPAQPAPPVRVIPNPYAPATASPDRSSDAYATGFAIGLGTALINKQADDERKRDPKPATERR